MPEGRTAFIPFLTLAAEWAEVSGQPPPLALRNMCEWTVVGAFPTGTLIMPSGENVRPLSVYEAFLATTNQGNVHIGGWTRIWTDTDALDHLNQVLVSEEGLQGFCEKTNTLPPPSILGGWKRSWLLMRHQSHLAPPSCP